MSDKKKKTAKKKLSWRDAPDIVKAVAATITAIGVITGALISCSSFISSKITESTNERLDSISKKLEDIELDTTRTQLLTLMNHYPENKSEILSVAYHYFKELDGDWYMSELFSEWAKERNIDVSHIMTIKE